MLPSIFIYGTAFTVSLAFARKYEKSNDKKSKRILFFFMIFAPVIVSGFRKNIGTDYKSYVESFNGIHSIGLRYIFNYYQEPLWFLVNIISPSKRIMFLLSSFIYSFFITLAICRWEKRTGVVLPLFISYMVFYHLSFNMIRQAIACAIVLLALTYIEESKKKYIILILIAFLFHKSAVFAVVFLFLKDRRKNICAFSGLIIISPFLMSLADTILRVILKRLGIYGKYLNEQPEGQTFGFLLYLIPVIFLTAVSIWISRPKDEEAVETSEQIEDCEIFDGRFYFFRIFLLQIPLQFLGNYIPFSDRMATYSLLVQVFLIPLLLKKIQRGSNKVIMGTAFAVWYAAYYIIMFVLLKSNEVYPYMWSIK